MANRIPTYVDATSEKISEIAEGDFLSTVGNGIAEGHSEISGGTPVVDPSTASSFSLTLSENTTLSFEDTPQYASVVFVIEILQDALDSGFTVTWPTGVAWPDSTAPTLSSGANKKDIFVFTNSYVSSGKTNGFVGYHAGKNI